MERLNQTKKSGVHSVRVLSIKCEQEAASVSATKRNAGKKQKTKGMVKLAEVLKKLANHSLIYQKQLIVFYFLVEITSSQRKELKCCE